MPGFTPTGSMSVSRSLRSAARLADGRVLVAGGRDPQDTVLRTAELYAPQSGTWSPAGSLVQGHDRAVLVAVPGGAVLVGGDEAATDTLLETWDSATGQWTATVVPPFMGRVAGAWADGDELLVLSAPESLLDDMEFRSVHLDSGQVDRLPSPITPRLTTYECRLSDGRILLAGGACAGIGGDGEPVEYLTRQCEVYDPATGAWQAVGHLAVPHMSLDRSGQSLVALPDGGALMVCGSEPGGDGHTGVVERWSAATGSWSLEPPLPESRDAHTTTLLPDDSVLVVGGEGPAGTRSDCHSFDLAGSTWSGADGLSRPRQGHVAVPLAGSGLLVVDGARDGSCERFG
ncbi:Kelch repeat-containing protein [Geodermatophilus sp. URMC 61]|uniref:Kelch repeat-containing protein n=1 Tax=Geodermatophilus sp. URMC 61 TaxID=3423411 RepID=UPI00406D006B